MKKYDSFLIGHITYDEMRDHLGNNFNFFGGAELFSSYAAWYMGAHVGLLTKMDANYSQIKDLMPFANEDVYFLESKKTTSMLNWYRTADKEKRDLVVNSIADSFKISDIPQGIESEIYHLAGLICGDYEEGMIEHLAAKGKVAIDMQGFLRCYDEDSKTLVFRDYEKKNQIFPHITFLKTDAVEAETLTGEVDRRKAAIKMYEWGAKEVMITHNTEVLVYDGKMIYTSPLKPRNLSGRTGRCDTTFSIYITERLRHSIKESLNFSAAAVSCKMETPGPLKKSRLEILTYRDSVYKAHTEETTVYCSPD